MAGLPDGFDLEALLAPIPGELQVGPDIRSDDSAQSPYYRLRDARNEARDAEKLIDAGSADARDPVPLWRAVRTLAQKTLTETTKDLEVAAWLTEALLRSHSFGGLAAGAQLMGELADRYWDTLYPMPDEYGMETRVAPITGLNGQDGGGALIQPLNKIVIFDRPDGTPFALYQYFQSEQLATLDPARQAARVSAGAIPFDTVDKEAKSAARRLTALRGDVQAALAAWERMAEVIDARAGADGPSTSHVRDLLRGVLAIVNRYAPPEVIASDGADDGSVGGAEDGGSTDGGGGPGMRIASGQALTREGALRALEDIAAYFLRTEPHSPLSYTLEEAVRRGRLTWPELLAEVLEDKAARNSVLTRLGIRPEAEEEQQSDGY